MFHHLTHRILQMIIRRPVAVLVTVLLLAVPAAVLGTRIEFRDSRADLASPGDPEQERFDRLIRDFHGSTALIAAVEPEDGAPLTRDRLRRFADELAERLHSLPQVDAVFHRVEIDTLLRGGLWALPPEDLDLAAEVLENEAGGIGDLLARFGPEALTRFLTRKIGSGSGDAPDESATRGLVQLVRLLELQEAFLEDPDRFLERLQDLGPGSLAAVAMGEEISDGYLATDDGRTLFLFISPADTADALPVQQELVTAVRHGASELVGEFPGFQVGLTGQPALVVEEMAAVSRDTWRSALVAVTGVFLLTLLVFRWKSHALLVLAALAVGVVLALGAVHLELGYLNLITSSFISTLIGVGIAYGIHPVSEYELMGAHTVPPEESVEKAYRHTGAAVATAGVTTAVAFFSIVLMKFRGFSELGLVAGGGVLFCLASALVFLPALLVLYARRRRRRGVRRTRREIVAAMDRLWLERGALHACRFPRTVSAIALLVTLGALWAAFGIRFDTNILKLVPAGLESVRYQERMTWQSEFSPVFSVVAVDRPDELQDILKRARTAETVSRVDSLLRFLPADPDGARAPAGRLAGMLRPLEIVAAEVDPAALHGALTGLEDALADAADQAFGAGYGEIAGLLEEALEVVESSSAIVAAAGPERRARWNRALPTVAASLESTRELVLGAVDSPPPGPSDLPESIRKRFMTRSGRLLAFLQPAGDVFDPVWLERYVADCRRIAEESTGFPIVFHHMSQRITSGFYRAVAAGAVLVFVVLLIDYRRVGPAVLALVPLGIGMIWMLGAMRLVGLQFNFANLVAVPLIIGVGIDNGVHIVHRLQFEGREGMTTVLRHTGRAILIASLTTMIGFGSLAVASHRGMSSLGIILLLGVGSCLLTSMVVLPNLLVALGRVRR